MVVTYHRVSPSILFHKLAVALGVSDNNIGIFSAMYFWPYAILQPIIGVLSDLINPVLILSIASFLCTVGSFTIAFSTNFSVCCFGRCLIGLGCGPMTVSIGKLFINWFNFHGFFIFQSLVLAAGAVGGVLAQGPLNHFISTIDYTYSFIGMGVIGVLLSFMTYIIAENPTKSRIIHHTYGKTEQIIADNRPTGKEFIKAKFRSLVKNLKTVLTKKQFWILLIYFTLTPGLYYSFSSMWGNPYLIAVLGYESQKASNCVIMLNIAWIVGSPILTFISEILKTRKKILIPCALGFFLINLGLCFVNSSVSEPFIYVLVFIYGIFGICPFSLGLTMFKEMEENETGGTAMGCANFFPFMSATLLEVMTTEILNASNGEPIKQYQYALWIPSIVFAGLGFVSSLFTIETYPQTDDDEDFSVSQPEIGEPMIEANSIV